MAWDKHHRKTYYYRKRRVNGQVVTDYIGRARVAALASRLDAIEAEAIAKEIARDRAHQERFDRMEKIVAAYEARVKMLVTAHLLINGYHKHKGQWRKKRVKPTQPPK